MKYLWAILIIAIVALGIVGFAMNTFDAPAPEFSATITEQETNSPAINEVRVITIDAQRFQFTPNMITIKKGQAVKIIVNNKDTAHGISIPELNVRGIDSVEFTANETGTFEFRCPTQCGSGHREMKGMLIVE